MYRRAEYRARVVPALLALLLASAGAWARPAGTSSANPRSGEEPEPSSAGREIASWEMAPASPAAPEGAAEAQEAGTNAGMGLYKGKVSDRKGGKPVSDAVVVFTNEESNETYEARTDDNGLYEVQLPAGEYVVDIKVGRKTYRSTGTFKEEAAGKRWSMDFTIGTKLTEKDFKIETTPRNIRVIQAEPRPPLEASKKWMEFFIFVGGLAVIGALAN